MTTTTPIRDGRLDTGQAASVPLLGTVPVTVAALHAAADLLELVGGFFGHDPAARVCLGRYAAAVDAEPDADPVLEGTLVCRELAETVELLRALANGGGAAMPSRTGGRNEDRGGHGVDIPALEPLG